MSLVWDILYLFALVFGLPVLLYRMCTQRKYRSGILERLGALPRRAGSAECLWVHGVSVGEVLAARTLIEEFRKRRPDWDVVVSTTTDTGLERARTTYPDCLVIRYPLDFTIAIRSAFVRIRPSLIVLMELEMWPNFVRQAHRQGIPVVIVNGRLSERGFRLQKRFRFLLARSYDRLARIAAQTPEYAGRFAGAGAPAQRITVTGSLKYDAVPRHVGDAEGLRRELGVAADEKLIVAGSTTIGEEEILLDVYSRLKVHFPKLRLAVVPRHPERFDAAEAIILRRGFACLRRSKVAGGKGDGSAVILGDTMGELVRFYAAASVVFVGKSLAYPGGGQNMMEPAALGKPVVFGPHTANFAETRDLLLASEAAVEVRDARSLQTALKGLLEDEKRSAEMGTRARAVIDAARGATERTLDILEEVLASDARAV